MRALSLLRRHRHAWALALLACAALLLATPSALAVPSQLTLLGSLSDSAGAPADGDYTVTVALYGDAAATTPFWTETLDVAVATGEMALVLGTDTLNPLVSAAFKDRPQVWVGLTVDSGPGVAPGGEQEIPRKLITAVGYAFAANEAMRADQADQAAAADFAISASRATTAAQAQTATTADTADFAQTVQAAAYAETATTADAVDSATSASTADRATSATSATAATTTDHAATATHADHAVSATAAQDADQAGSAATADYATYAATVASAQIADSATTATSANSATTATLAASAQTAHSAVSAGSADTATTAASAITALHADSATSAGTADHATTVQTATSAASATTANTANHADHATRAQSAASADALACAQCVALRALAFDPVTEAELNAALASIRQPTTLDDMTGGAITSALTVSGGLSAGTLIQGGEVVCDASGNCGQTLSQLTCLGQNIRPRRDPNTDRWTCVPARSSHAAQAATADGADDLDCVGCVAAGELGFDPATQAELDAAVSGIDVPDSVDGLGGGGITSAVTVEGQLSATAFNQGGEPVCDTSGNCGQSLAGMNCSASTTIVLWDPIEQRWRCAADSATDAEHAAEAANAGLANDVSCSGCVTTTHINFDPALQSELQPAFAGLTDDLEDVEVPDSLDGLGGGTITSGVDVEERVTADIITLTGTLNATRIEQNGHQACDAGGNCGTPIGQIVCDPDQIIVYDGTSDAWQCTDPPEGGEVIDPGETCAIGQYKHWTGDAWTCRTVNQVNDAGDTPNGFLIVDDWGDAWDGIRRLNARQADAAAQCAAVGGRLPTVTELYRNNGNHPRSASNVGTGNLAQTNEDDYLWTLVPSDEGDHFITVRLKDGATEHINGLTTDRRFRCIWPSHDSDAFDGNYCFGPPGSACREKDGIWHVDQRSRPPVPIVSAVFECNFYNASLLTQREYSQLITSPEGFPSVVNTSWHFTTEVERYQNSNHYQTILHWDEDHEPWWGFDNGSHGSGNEGDVSWGYTDHYFRCIGKKDRDIGTAPRYETCGPGLDAACCQGECFTITDRRSTLVADGNDRFAVSRDVAEQTCRGFGGALPTVNEATELIQQGWTNPTNTWLWTSEQTSWDTGNGRGYINYRWNDTQDPTRWYWTNGNATVAYPTTDVAFRCVWRETIDADFTTCDVSEMQVWDEDARAWACVPRGAGSSAGQANPGGQEFIDDWGNVFDRIERGAKTWDDADQTCRDLGGRLPTASELYRVRFDQALSQALGTADSNTWMWTDTVEYRKGYHVRIQLDDGATTGTTDSTASPFYCFWPADKGDAMAGSNCYGEPAAPCHEAPAVHLRSDRYDRVALPWPGAAHDCKVDGGWIPRHREFIAMVQAGAPNGTHSYLHESGPENWYDGGWGNELARWDGTGDGGWVATSQGTPTAGNGWEHEHRPFRCVFTDLLSD